MLAAGSPRFPQQLRIVGASNQTPPSCVGKKRVMRFLSGRRYIVAESFRRA
jgi:hypothetical protein